jgi:hypothetical protein
MESNKQEKANLLNVNFLAKHMSTPLAMGGGKGSGLYMNHMAPKMESDTPLEGNAYGKKMMENQEAGMSKEEAAKKAAQDLKK